ncbi:MAG: hypothetical protein SNH63_07920 [Rikenellaceae bacterium]
MKKLIQLVLAIAIAGLIYWIYVLISTPILFEKEKAVRDAEVVAHLKEVRKAQRAYKSKYQVFADDFDTLIDFVMNDSLELIRKIVDEDDSVAMAQLKLTGQKNVESYFVHVIDTVFAPSKLSVEDVKNIRYIPGTQTEYTLYTGQIMTDSKVQVAVVECVAPYKEYLDTVKYRQLIINLIDTDFNVYGRYPGLKFGSMSGGNNEAGNWE